MQTTLQKWGKKQGLRIPKHLSHALHIAVGDKVELRLAAGYLEIHPTKRSVRGRHRLEDLVARMPRHYRIEPDEWGRPVGNETW